LLGFSAKADVDLNKKYFENVKFWEART